jgi:tetratricopeptide (TPR) repeat protein
LKRLALDYKNAMGELARRYPDDLDAATLYAESGMDLHPWKLWTPDGKPAEGTPEIVAVLQSVLKRNPNHIGANHYYIHAVEASPHPEEALASAERLDATVKAAGHLVHMPAHIFIRVGDYEAAATSNEKAAAADRAYLVANEVNGIYGAAYYSHNLHFLSIAYSLEGRSSDARKAVDQLAGNIRPYLKTFAFFEPFVATQSQVLARFGMWDDILKSPAPDPSFPVTNSVWHWARGMAFASTGKVGDAEGEYNNSLP